MRTRSARVFLDGQFAGLLSETGTKCIFTYDAAWRSRQDSVPISLTMPVREAAYESNGLHPFFENLLPEGWLLELATSKLKIPKDDAFGMLLATCADSVGAIEIEPLDNEALS